VKKARALSALFLAVMLTPLISWVAVVVLSSSVLSDVAASVGAGGAYGSLTLLGVRRR
jgi:hypothetical protein